MTTTESTGYRDGAAWESGPQRVYERLARAALDRLADDVAAARILDAGAGTGASTRLLLDRGARVMAVDSSPSMLAELRRQTCGRVPIAIGDVLALPVADATFDYAVATFVINHLDEPADAIAELARVCRTGGGVLATTFGADEHPVKAAVDDVLADYGFTPPEWYCALKRECTPKIATPSALASVGARGGLLRPSVDVIDVDLDDLPDDAVIAYRLGLAHIAPFVAGLDEPTRVCLYDDLRAAVAPLPRLRLPMLVLRGAAPAQPSTASARRANDSAY